MNATIHLNENQLREAVAQYVARETGLEVRLNGVSFTRHSGMGGESFTATAQTSVPRQGA